MIPVQRCYDDNDQEVEHPDSLLNQTIGIADIDEPGKHQAVDAGEPEEKVDTSIPPISIIMNVRDGFNLFNQLEYFKDVYSLPTGVVQIVLDVWDISLNVITRNKEITNYADLE